SCGFGGRCACDDGAPSVHARPTMPHSDATLIGRPPSSLATRLHDACPCARRLLTKVAAQTSLKGGVGCPLWVGFFLRWSECVRRLRASRRRGQPHESILPK